MAFQIRFTAEDKTFTGDNRSGHAVPVIYAGFLPYFLVLAVLGKRFSI